jgi:hypothetical protein
LVKIGPNSLLVRSQAMAMFFDLIRDRREPQWGRDGMSHPVRPQAIILPT